MTNILEWLKAKYSERRERRAAQALADIEDRFSVAERGGKLYILCGRTAVACVEKSTTTDATIKAVKTMRAAATDYAKQLPENVDY